MLVKEDFSAEVTFEQSQEQNERTSNETVWGQDMHECLPLSVWHGDRWGSGSRHYFLGDSLL